MLIDYKMGKISKTYKLVLDFNKGTSDLIRCEASNLRWTLPCSFCFTECNCQEMICFEILHFFNFLTVFCMLKKSINFYFLGRGGGGGKLGRMGGKTNAHVPIPSPQSCNYFYTRAYVKRRGPREIWM